MVDSSKAKKKKKTTAIHSPHLPFSLWGHPADQLKWSQLFVKVPPPLPHICAFCLDESSLWGKLLRSKNENGGCGVAAARCITSSVVHPQFSWNNMVLWVSISSAHVFWWQVIVPDPDSYSTWKVMKCSVWAIPPAMEGNFRLTCIRGNSTVKHSFTHRVRKKGN